MNPTAPQVEIFLDVDDPDDVIIPELGTLSVGENPWELGEGMPFQPDLVQLFSPAVSAKQPYFVPTRAAIEVALRFG